MNLFILLLLAISMSSTLVSAAIPKCQQPRHRCPNGQVCTGHGCLDVCNGVPCPKGYRCKKNDCVKKSIFG